MCLYIVYYVGTSTKYILWSMAVTTILFFTGNQYEHQWHPSQLTLKDFRISKF